MWEIRNRLIVLLGLAASCSLFARFNPLSAALVFGADLLIFSVILDSPGEKSLTRCGTLDYLKVFWRTILLYAILIVASIYISLLMFSSFNVTGSESKTLYIIPSLLLVASILSSIALYIYPVPSAPPLIGNNKLIGTISFNISVEQTDKDNKNSEIHGCRTVQCWFPMKNCMPTPSGRSILWTSGNKETQFKESQVLLDAVAASSKIPSFVLRHLSFSRSHSYGQESFKNIAQPPENTHFPVAVYCHGLYGWRQIHNSLCETLASFGFVVFSMDHYPDCTISRFATTDPLPCPSNPADHKSNFHFERFSFQVPPSEDSEGERAFYQGGLKRRMKDITTLLDMIESGSIYQRFPELPNNSLDVSKVYICGHSYGGGTASALSCKDTRVSAVVNLDGWMYPILDEVRRAGSLKAPVLNLSAEFWKYAKVQGPFRDDFIQASRKNLARELCSTDSDAPVFDLTIRGTDHQNFCDIGISASQFLLQAFSVVGSAQPHTTKRLIEAVVAAFFIRQLTQDKDGRDAIYYCPNNKDYALKPEKGDFYSLMGDQPLDVSASASDPLGETERLIQYCFEYSSKKKNNSDGSDSRIPSGGIFPEHMKAFMTKHVCPSETFRSAFDYSFFRKYNP